MFYETPSIVNVMNNVKADLNIPKYTADGIPIPIRFTADNQPIYASGTDFSKIPYYAHGLGETYGALQYPSAKSATQSLYDKVPAYQTPKMNFDEDAFVKSLIAQPDNTQYEPNIGMFTPRVPEPQRGALLSSSSSSSGSLYPNFEDFHQGTGAFAPKTIAQAAPTDTNIGNDFVAELIAKRNMLSDQGALYTSPQSQMRLQKKQDMQYWKSMLSADVAQDEGKKKK